MIRKLVLGAACVGVGYLGGLLFGYRAAVVDYVENDAQTIKSMAQTMYETREMPKLVENLSEEEIEQLPDEVQSYLEGEDKEDESGDERGFR